MGSQSKATAEANILRRHSEPTLIPPTIDDSSERSLDALSIRRKLNRRRTTHHHGSRASLMDDKDDDALDSNHAKILLLTWREIAAGILILSAFMTCVSVFFLLGDDDSRELSSSNNNCESKTFLQQKLVSYLAKDQNEEGAEGYADFPGTSNDTNGTCSYSFNICSPSVSVTLENLETILYVLLVGALLTVVGVTVLFLDDSEDALMQLWMARSNRTPSQLMTDFSENTSWGGNASFGRLHNPMADLFPDTSVLFADIVGFEAWSSQREPTQCLTLLETIYAAFDRLAKSRRIYKVEAVADCYTAAAGLPDARSDHAEALLQFAHDCRACFKETTKALEVTLGPDTSDLSLRVGVHRYVLA